MSTSTRRNPTQHDEYTRVQIENVLRGLRAPNLKKSLLHDLAADKCWPWAGYVSPTGYGRAYRIGVVPRTPVAAHRLVWTMLNGPLSDGTQLDHTCHDHRICKRGSDCPHRRCVNPNHLTPVTPKQNSERSGSPIAENGRKTHCLRGHEFNAENTAPHDNNYGRRCRVCEAIRSRERRARAGARPRPARRTINVPGATP